MAGTCGIIGVDVASNFYDGNYVERLQSGKTQSFTRLECVSTITGKRWKRRARENLAKQIEREDEHVCIQKRKTLPGEWGEQYGDKVQEEDNKGGVACSKQKISLVGDKVKEVQNFDVLVVTSVRPRQHYESHKLDSTN